MTELTDLNDTDALNTAVTGNSTEGNTANMGGMDNLFQATLGMLSRFRNANIFRLRDNTDTTKLLAFDLSGLTTATTRTLTAPDASGTVMLTSTGVTNAQALTGAVVQTAEVSFVTYTSITSAIPQDDTKPQITEGNPIFSFNFTPRSTTNKLTIKVSIPCTGSGLINVIAALFVAGGTDAVQVGIKTIPGADYFETLTFEYSYVPGTTSATNIQVRCGPDSGTMYINGSSAARRFGGAMAATISVQESKA